MFHFRPITFRVSLGVIFLLLFSACQRPAFYRQESYVFGTRVEVLVAGVDESRARPAVAAVLREFDRLHRTCHAWRASPLSELNAALAAGKTLEVDEEMAALLIDAQRLSALGDGLFDPGIGGLIGIWGFHSDEFRAELPDPSVLSDWRKNRTGIADLEIDGRRVGSRSRRVAIDLGGYLKGYALDRAAAILRAHDIGNALINIGGNVMALGDRNGKPWRVGLMHPRQPGPLVTLELFDGEAIGTSGDYQRFFELDGKRYSHLLDPRSGEPVMHTQALSVLISPRPNAGTLSDVATKPLFIAGAAWPEFAERFGIDQVLRVDAAGQLDISPKMRERIEGSAN
ncbi:MAG: FAD:protein FMN transferase [Candidatus Accumulibacter sp.]|jgi:thiamine biosynthesis lipoprotein|nr:FAD:protein FMN transferase [Accumulibacter sp.]